MEFAKSGDEKTSEADMVRMNRTWPRVAELEAQREVAKEELQSPCLNVIVRRTFHVHLSWNFDHSACGVTAGRRVNIEEAAGSVLKQFRSWTEQEQQFNSNDNGEVDKLALKCV